MIASRIRWTAILGFLALGWASPARGQGLLWEASGEQAAEQFAYSLSSTGDIDSDGIPDVIVGSPHFEQHYPYDLQYVGLVQILSGKDGLEISRQVGASYEDWFGTACAELGDIDGDGFADLVVGAPEINTATGRASVYSGRTWQRLFDARGQGIGDDFGTTLATLGDIDGDGFRDFAVGAPRALSFSFQPGTVEVRSGRDAALIWRFIGHVENGSFGDSIANAGDIDGDGIDDLIVGCKKEYSSTCAGNVHLYSMVSGREVYRICGLPQPQYAPSFGVAVAGIGDVDGDGAADFLVGQPLFQRSSMFVGAAHVYSGRTGDLLVSLYGDESGSQFGQTALGLGDIDGDGRPDFAVSAPGEPIGRIYVYSGRTMTRILELQARDANEAYGASLAARDLNHDGIAELIVGTPSVFGELSAPGRMEVYSLACGSTKSYGSGCPGSGGFVPLLTVDGCAVPGGRLEARIEQGLGGAQAYLLASTTGRTAVPFLGCTLTVHAPFLLGQVTLSDPPGQPGAGEAVLPQHVPNEPWAVGLVAELQAFIADPAGPRDFAATNAVEVRFQ